MIVRTCEGLRMPAIWYRPLVYDQTASPALVVHLTWRVRGTPVKALQADACAPTH